MAISPATAQTGATAPHLRRFDCAHAALVADWVRTPQEAQWLAPRTKPPITAQTVLGWQAAGRQSYELAAAQSPTPVAYGELNVLRQGRNEFWLGHLLVDPAQRGLGYGVELTRLLLDRAFLQHAARRVVLVVFPENAAAIAAYERAGMRRDGAETHYFPAYQQEVRLLRMEARG